MNDANNTIPDAQHGVAETTPLPRERVVAIVGRPNVGKSALFNRIARQRIAIVHDQPGVTRDRLMHEVEFENQRFQLVDTGGISLLSASGSKNPIESGTRAQVDAALGDAAVVVLVVDVLHGLHPMDAEVAQMIRQTSIPCICAVNKCDLDRHEEKLHEFNELGFPLFPVSAAHDRGIVPLLDDILFKLPKAAHEPTETKPLRVAIVGRPNAGKSAYINRLLNNDRVIVSDVPGTTRDSIEVAFTIGHGPQAHHYTLIDTAGMRHVHKIDSSVERFSHFRAEKTVATADICLLVMDATVGPTVQDKHIAALIQKHQKGCLLVINKWDLAMEQGLTQTQYEPSLRKEMPFINYCPMVFISAKEGYNVRRSIDVIDLVAGNVNTRLPTGILNRTLETAAARVKPPSAFGKSFRFYYAVQTGTAPVALRLFCNDPRIIKKQYTDYLIRSLRENFDLVGAPVLIFYRARTRPERGTATTTATGAQPKPKAKPKTKPAAPRKPTAMKKNARPAKPRRRPPSR